MANPTQHEDFGEKIGGARKDLWKERGLYADDLLEMNSREAEKYVKKDNIWKKPDYDALIKAGAPVDLTYFIKVVRDSLPAAPQYYRTDDTPEKRLARQKQYIQTIREVQAVVESVKTVEDALSAFDRCMIAGGYFQREERVMSYRPSITATEKGRENPAITNKLANALYFRSERDYEQKIVREVLKNQFGVPKEQKVPRGFEIRFNDGKNTYSRGDDWQPNTYYVAKGYRILKTNFETRGDALKWVQDFAKQRAASGKKRFVPEQLAHVRREGPDYRAGRNVAGQDYLGAFGFRGGEFGNWMSQADRQASLNMGFDALKDLAAALQISEKDIAYQGTLAIAFGARGSGSAVAHYEPERKVINLTKMRGAGSLAHEWWHGLDDYLGEKMGVKGLLSETPRAYPLMKKLVDAMKYKSMPPEQAAEQAVRQNARYISNAENRLDSAVLYSLQRADSDKAMEEYAALKSSFLAGEQGAVDKISDFKKSVTGRVIPKSEREALYSYEHLLSSIAGQTEPPAARMETDYYRNSKKMGQECEKDGGYWESNTEMTARAFACYVMDKLRPERSDYLCGHAECAVTFVTDKDGNIDILKAYPQGEERKVINAVFDEIVADLKLEQIFTHSDRPQPLQVQEAAPPAVRQEIPAAVGDEQLTLFGSGGKPSVLGQLAASKAQSKGVQTQEASKKPREPVI